MRHPSPSIHAQYKNPPEINVHSTREYAYLNEEKQALQHDVTLLRNEIDQLKKKSSAKEKQLKARENSITLREASQKEREDQLLLLKDLCNCLETEKNDLRDQNKLLKLKLLASDEMKRDEPTGNSIYGTKINLNSQPADVTERLLREISNLSHSVRQMSSSFGTRITNVYQPPHRKRQYQGPSNFPNANWRTQTSQGNRKFFQQSMHHIKREQAPYPILIDLTLDDPCIASNTNNIAVPIDLTREDLNEEHQPSIQPDNATPEENIPSHVNSEDQSRCAQVSKENQTDTQTTNNNIGIEKVCTVQPNEISPHQTTQDHNQKPAKSISPNRSSTQAGNNKDEITFLEHAKPHKPRKK